MMLRRPPLSDPPPSSEIRSKMRATFLPWSGLTSMLFSAPRMLASTRRCSVAKRLPPPWLGMPVKVPQPVRVVVRKQRATAAAMDRTGNGICPPEWVCKQGAGLYSLSIPPGRISCPSDQRRAFDHIRPAGRFEQTGMPCLAYCDGLLEKYLLCGRTSLFGAKVVDFFDQTCSSKRLYPSVPMKRRGMPNASASTY